jgi:hypothetical protein
MAPLSFPLFEPGPSGSPLRTEHEPTTLANEPTALDAKRDPVTAETEPAKLVVTGYAELVVKKSKRRNDMKLHHKRSRFATSGSQGLDRRAR